MLSLVEKGQIQPLDRTQPGLPMKKGRAHTMTHDYKAAWNHHVVCRSQHARRQCDGHLRGASSLSRMAEVPVSHRSPNARRQTAPPYPTHKHPAVLLWAARHKRFHFHFTPTSSSWLNMVERFFRDLTENQLRRGVFTSVEALQERILAYIQEHNRQPKPFIWTAKANDILEKVKRAKAK